jgi:fatty acid desaturase/membrane-associated phospholipid phosphatase/phytoene/squalene synthetase
VPIEPSRDRLPIPGRLNLALLGLASLASASLLFGASHASSGWLVFAYAVGFSFTANTLFSLLHEAVHGLFSNHRSLNEWAGRWAAAWFPTGFAMQRAFHLTHHRNNRSEAEQFDVLHVGDVKWLKHAQWYAILTGLYWPVAVAGVLVHLVVPEALRTRVLRIAGAKAAEQTSAQQYLGAIDRLNPLTSRLEVMGSVAFQVALFCGLNLSFLGWAACYAAFAFSWSSLQYTDHAFSPLDARVGAWNLQVGPIVRAFFLNYHFHLAHHQHPSVPWNYLGMDAAPGPRFLEVWREAWRGPRDAKHFPHFAVSDVAGTQGWGLPTGVDAHAALIFSLAFLAVFVVFFGGTSVLSAFIPWRAEVALPFELDIPFRPEWSIVYLSMIPLLLLLPLARRRWHELFPVFVTLVAETIVASAFFIAFPVQSTFPLRDATGPWVSVFFLADTLNLERNLFPSLHVAFAVTAVLALAPTVSRRGRLLLLAWASAIAASTLLIHEHHVVDVVAGVLLAMLAWRHVGQWAARADVLVAADVELLCLRNEWLFARRHRRYGLIALLLLVDRLPRWRKRRVLSAGFCFLQAVDDVMDGDRPSSREPLDLIDELMQAIRNGRFGDDDLMRLANAFVSDLRLAGKAAAVDDVLALMAVMRRDRCRAIDHTLWGGEELREHHRRTFTLSLNLLLAARGSDLSAADVPGLVDAFGWCSTVRDLREDISAGLINVPLEVVRAARMDGSDPVDLDALIRSDAMRAWMESERDRATALLDETQSRIDTLKARPGVEILKLFTRSIRGFADRRFARLYPTIAAGMKRGLPQLDR